MPHEECSCPDCIEGTEWPAKKRRLYLGDEVHIGWSAENVKIRNLRKRILRRVDAVECNLHLVELLERTHRPRDARRVRIRPVYVVA